MSKRDSFPAPSAINKLLERLSKRAIKQGRLDRQISPHKLRHGNAYEFYNQMTWEVTI